MAPAMPTLTGPDIDLRIGHSSLNVDGRAGHAVTINGTVPGPLLRFWLWAAAVLVFALGALYVAGLAVAPELQLVSLVLKGFAILVPFLLLMVFPAIAADAPAASLAARLDKALEHWEGNVLRFLAVLLAANLASFVWRAVMRFAFTAREYGWREGMWAVVRIPVANVIAIMAGRRALVAYVRTLRGAAPRWDKTFHHAHPAMASLRSAA